VSLASLLLAVELNGQQLSRGSEVLLEAHQTCLVIADLLRAQVKPGALPTVTHNGQTYLRIGDTRSDDENRCQIDESVGVARITLAAERLQPKPLTIGQPNPMNQAVALVNQPVGSVQTIPSLAVDLLAGSSSQTVGLTASLGNTQVFAQQSLGLGLQQPNWSSETLFSSGASLVIGHQPLLTGLANTPVTTTGISLSSRAQALRQSQTHANLVLQSPSRLRFLDPNGNTLYSSNLLTTGQYQVSGLLGSPGPGLLQVEVIGADGQRQIVGLPWTNSPLLLGPSEQIIDTFVGSDWQQFKLHRGLSIAESLRLQAERYAGSGEQHRFAAGLSSRRWSRWLVSVDLGLDCGPARSCKPEHRLQSIFRKDRFLQLTLEDQGSAGRFLGLSLGTASGYQTSLSMGQSVTGEFQAFASWQRRLGKGTQLQLQWRHSGLTGNGVLVSLHLPLGHQTTSDASLQTNRSGRPSLQASLHRRPAGEYGSSISLTRREGPLPSQALDLRQEAAIGSLSLSARRLGSDHQIQGQLASRLWVTSEGLTLGRLSDANLVVHTTGLSKASMQQNQQASQQADDQGRIWFANAPAWSKPDYRIAAKSLPFYIDWRGGQASVPTTKRRAYLVDHRHHWRLQLTSKLNLATDALAGITDIRQRDGRAVSFSPDGYVDLSRPSDLPLRVRHRNGIVRLCGQPGIQPNENGELLLDCTVESQPPKGPSLQPGHKPLLEAQTTEPPPSSG
jgi:hypothetical protein